MAIIFESWWRKVTEKIAFNVNEAAEFIGVSTTTIYKKAKAGEIPHVRIGARIIFHRGVLESWLKGELPETSTQVKGESVDHATIR